jgi:DUF4097 and DUF4098 domain-containing protein YvlB
MPSFDTPEPIAVTIDLPCGDVRLTASDRADTVVEVRPSNPGSVADVRAAERTRVEYADGALLIKAPEQRGFFGRNGAIDVTIALPTGSQVGGDAALGDFHAQGPLGECRLNVASGDIQLEQTAALWLEASNGDVTVGRAAGEVAVSSASGDVRLRQIDGAATIRNSNGESWVGEIAGDLQVSAANGDVVVERARAGVRVRTANGDVRLREVAHGTVVIESASGDIDVGIRAGSAAWLDVSTLSGDVRTLLDAADGPGDAAATVELRARTTSGDIVVRRA